MYHSVLSYNVGGKNIQVALCYRASYGSVNNIPSHTYRYPRRWRGQLSRASEEGGGGAGADALIAFFLQIMDII